MSHSVRFTVLGSAVVGLIALAVACGGGSSSPSSPSPSPTTTPTPATTITISASGVVSPRDITVAPGSRVTFVNNDSRSHEMNSDPHPDHTDCREINAISFIAAGQTKLTDNLNTVRTCGFHDHNQPSNASLQGTIRIQ
jgi:plastocyanin